jgi:ABC-type branched-subunit amino acid transport system substrate-binding protein
MKIVHCIFESIKNEGVELIAVCGEDRIFAESIKQEVEKQLKAQWLRSYGSNEEIKEEFKKYYKVWIKEEEVIESREDIEILKLEVLK